MTQETTRDLKSRLGGKGAKLARLQQLECAVPPWFGIEASSFSIALAHRDVQAAMARARDHVAAGDHEAASSALRQAILRVPVPDDVQREVLDGWSALGPGLVAVRSSAIGEDSDEFSFAGQFDSVLGVASQEQLLDAVRTCWASAYTSRAIAYRARHGIDPLEASMGLVVQRQVDSDVSGVMFTADPISGDPYSLVISSTWGLGEALVSGIANADTYRVDRRSGAVDEDVADKDVQVVLAPGGLTEETTVPEHLRTAPTLSTHEVRELADMGQLLETAEGCPQDVEWAIHDGKLYVLQTRPITSSLRPRGIRRVWDNSNIVESYAGVVSPLTFSFAREAYGAVYLQFLRLLRLPAAEMPRAQVVVRQMLGYLDGRVYYNLASWYYLLSVLPGYEKNQGAMEQMMGVRQGLDQRAAPRAGAFRKIRVSLHLAWQLLTIRRSIAAFRSHLYAVLQRHEHDLGELDADQLVEAYEQLKLDLLSNWQVPIVNDFRVMLFFDRLKRRIEQLDIDDAGTLQNDLLCGQGEVESAEPTYLLMRIAERVRSEPSLRELVLECPDGDLREAVRTHGSEAARYADEQLEVYLRRFGDRCANELKLETPTLRENPAFLYSVLRNFVRQGELSEAGMLAREQEIRNAAEQAVRDRMRGRRFGRLRLRVFWWVLSQARGAVRDREALRFDRTRVFGLARRILAALGERLHESGLLDDPRDVFFLEVDEVVGTVQGTCTTADIRMLVALRKAEHERWLEQDLPDRIETLGITNANPFEDAYAAVDTSGDSMSGIGCCPGTVERPARVVHSPDAGVTLDGDIMVCTRTDPGWVPLFPSCGGLLVERGSLLSHSAIVAREFGIPAIVGIPGLMQWARDGELLRMDGASGTVRRAEGSAPTAGTDGAAGAADATGAAAAPDAAAKTGTPEVTA